MKNIKRFFYKLHYTLIFIFISSFAFGQKHLIGMQGGLNFTNFTSEVVFENTTIRTGFVGGITYDLMLNESYRIGVDVFYSQQGARDIFIVMNEQGEYVRDMDIKMYYDYLSVPVKIGYELGDKIRFIPKLGVVPAFAIKTEITAPAFNENRIVTGEVTLDHINYVSKFDTGGIAEIGMETDVSKNIVFCSNLNYKRSLTTFSNSNYNEGAHMRHYGFSITAGIKYRLNDINTHR
ncbi:hypothetical protein SDC9_143689 [bioreactor metagenome]|uniref:Outer membrane protein beta-barrel domain-containing protein n=1 Tax=bioreactor metagenome TaxID=1076179 RepID=A0A645E4U0_9ZZZZ